MRKDLAGFVKAGKLNETRQTSCLTRVTKCWGVQHRDRCARLNYLCSSQTFYRKVITVVRLATTSLRYKMAIWKLNNIMINWLTNSQPSIFPDKWRFDTSQDWDVLGDDFDSVSLETIPDATLQTLVFTIPPWVILQKEYHNLLMSLTNQS